MKEYFPYNDITVEDTYDIPFKIEGKNYDIQIIDTAGELDYMNMLHAWIEASEGFLLVFDIKDKSSFEYIKIIYPEIIKCKGSEDIPKVLIGNIKDFNEKREVSFQEASSFAYSLKIEYKEISLDNDLNYKEPFEIIIKRILISNKGKYKKTKKDKCIIF